MVFCRQKHKHCFVACCAALLGKNTEEAQDEIVSRFPAELDGPTEGAGCPTSGKALDDVLFGLGLSYEPPRIYEAINGDHEPVLKVLRENARRLQEMIIVLRYPTNHAILAQRILPRGVVVMDPAGTDFAYWSWEALKSRKPEVLHLKRSLGR